MARRVVAVVGSVVVGACALLAGPVVAQEPEPERRVLDVERRVLDVEGRIIGVASRIEDVVVEAEGSTEIAFAADVLFAFGSAELGAEARSQLVGAVDRVRDAAPSRLSIEGHTDGIGDAGSNQVLSEQRAEAVRSFLAGELPAIALDARGFGETMPVAPEINVDGVDDPAGRQLNRRVTLVLVP